MLNPRGVSLSLCSRDTKRFPCHCHSREEEKGNPIGCCVAVVNKGSLSEQKKRLSKTKPGACHKKPESKNNYPHSVFVLIRHRGMIGYPNIFHLKQPAMFNSSDLVRSLGLWMQGLSHWISDDTFSVRSGSHRLASDHSFVAAN
ncbi:hypothetical protein CDAR_238931 [Caerostris darwini]|uniref:Uncharacterized protein n=1 Tax=Caerostris darwini TaxID=1538125 RepID=A0AAV4PSH4_9ARAC|nr:hypothetical protein CDAR_238931 [Caerostris darwini]